MFVLLLFWFHLFNRHSRFVKHGSIYKSWFFLFLSLRLIRETGIERFDRFHLILCVLPLPHTANRDHSQKSQFCLSKNHYNFRHISYLVEIFKDYHWLIRPFIDLIKQFILYNAFIWNVQLFGDSEREKTTNLYFQNKKSRKKTLTDYGYLKNNPNSAAGVA